MTADGAAAPTFDLDQYLKLPRVAGLVLSPDGGRLVTSVATPGPDGKKFTSALWELDPAGREAPRRLTRSAPGEANAAFLPDGSLLFTSTRDDPEAAGGRHPGRDRPAAGGPRRRHRRLHHRRPPRGRRPGGRRAPRAGPQGRRGQRQ